MRDMRDCYGFGSDYVPRHHHVLLNTESFAEGFMVVQAPEPVVDFVRLHQAQA